MRGGLSGLLLRFSDFFHSWFYLLGSHVLLLYRFRKDHRSGKSEYLGLAQVVK